MQQSGSKFAIRHVRQLLKQRDSQKTVMDTGNSKGLLARNTPKSNKMDNGIDSIADYVLSIRKAFNNE